MTPQESYDELEITYDAIQEYLDGTIMGPEHEQLLEYHNQLGEKMYAYNAAIIEENSTVINASLNDLKAMADAAKEARDALDDTSDILEKVAKVARGLDKAILQIQKLV